MNQITTTTKVAARGSSLTITITKEARALDIKPGEYVKVTLEKVKN